MKVLIYMKSGNVLTLRGIKSCDVENTGNALTSITISRYPWAVAIGYATRLMVTTLDMSQVEAVMFSRWSL